MTTHPSHAAGVHEALHEVVTSHPVLVRGAVGKMSKGQIAQLMVFEIPKVDQPLAHVKAHRAIVVLPFDRIGKRLAL